MRPGRQARRPTTPRSPAPKTDPVDGVFRVEHLGAEGDGVVRDGTRVRHVRGVLPGELVRAAGTSEPLTATAILEPSADRVAPPCRLFGRCGGCTLQHQDPAATLAWKQGRVLGALAEAGYHEPVARPAFQAEPASRRRVALAFARNGAGTVTLGLHAPRSTAIVDMTECHVIAPSLVARLAPLRDLLARLGPVAAGGGQLAINLLDNGADILIRSDGAPSAADHASIAAFAAVHAVPRVSWQDARSGGAETLVLLERPRVTFGGRIVEPAPGAFLQAAPSAEAAIVADVLAALPARSRPGTVTVELFAGSGTLTFPIAAGRRVRAFDGDGEAFAALARAAGGTRVEAVRRDLARAPLAASEFRDAAAVVLDPPHGGAARQVAEVALARAPSVVLVSCNPAALAREAAILRRAGYRLDATRAIDQFLHSARVESVSAFRLD